MGWGYWPLWGSVWLRVQTTADSRSVMCILSPTTIPNGRDCCFSCTMNILFLDCVCAAPFVCWRRHVWFWLQVEKHAHMVLFFVSFLIWQISRWGGESQLPRLLLSCLYMLAFVYQRTDISSSRYHGLICHLCHFLFVWVCRAFCWAHLRLTPTFMHIHAKLHPLCT